jgi:hypothetical protein
VGLKLAGIMLIVMCAMGGLGYWYYNDTQEKLATLHENNAKLETAVAISEELQKVNNEFRDIRAQNNVLSKKLAKHDLSELGSKKPGLVGKIINNASDKAGRCFEILSGAKLTEKEIGAKNGKAFNSECPWLWPGNTVTK